MRKEHENAVTAVVIDSHRLRQQHSKALLQRRAIDVVGFATTVGRAAELVDAHACDVLIVRIDTGSEPRAVYSALRKAHKHHSTLVSVAIVEDEAPAVVEAALAAGVYATIGRAAGLQEVARLAFAGLAEQRADGNGNGNGHAPARARLTRREIEILRLVAEGRSNREVAKLLWVTDQTVKFHLANTYRKLGVSNRGEASEWAAVRGLVRLSATRAARAELPGLVSRSSRRTQGDAVAVTP
jgi:DNA-binding NarL/FixJ family response regulator